MTTSFAESPTPSSFDASWRIVEEPKPVSDRCVVCNKKKHPERSAKYAPGVAARDPYCSRDCLRVALGLPLPPGGKSGQAKRYEDADDGEPSGDELGNEA